MKSIQLGKVESTVAVPGLGTMGMSDMYGSQATRSDTECIQTIRAALDMGINFLDKDYYGAGHNEMLIREALKGRSSKPVISENLVLYGRLPGPGLDLIPGRRL
jgi:aryl-alcohol dehydrogenase-like predicted oxidoreductase